RVAVPATVAVRGGGGLQVKRGRAVTGGERHRRWRQRDGGPVRRGCLRREQGAHARRDRADQRPDVARRKGELLGLRKSDVDLASRLIIVSRSYDRETTKGGHAEAIPIAAELVPYLRAALKASPSGLVFPDADGRML